jgi:geranylgeranyl diphosphate synthase type II
MEVQRLLRMRAAQVDAALKKYLPSAKTPPSTLHTAMRYSMFAGGKRLRPILCLEAATALGAEDDEAMPLACALEMIHTYSLIHDDLPAMDNDDFRRGRPTCHKVYGDAIAILAGDALLTLAFETIAHARTWPRYNHADLLRELAVAAGSRQLIAGQVADIENEGKPINARQLQSIHERKTGALFTTSLRLGAMAANATPRQLKAITNFGRALGLAFQIIDDILDCVQTSEKLGKSAGKDVAAQKATYPALLGIDGAKKAAAKWTARAMESLKPLGKNSARLLALADYMLHREH